MDDLLEWLGTEALGSFEVVGDDVVAFLENCDYLTVTPDDLESLQEFTTEASLFAVAGTPSDAASDRLPDAEPGTTDPSLAPEEGCDGQGKTKAEIAREELKSAARAVAFAEGSIALNQALKRRDMPDQPAFPSVQGEVAGQNALHPEVDLDLFTVSATRSVQRTRCICSKGREEGYPFLSMPKCPHCGGNDPLGLLWQQHGEKILAASERTIHEQCCAISSGLYRAIAGIEGKIGSALRAANNSTRLAAIENGDDSHAIARALINFFDPVMEATNANVTSTVFDRVRMAATNEIGMISTTLRSEGNGLRERIWAGGGGINPKFGALRTASSIP
jgi:hypothetical protein